MRLSPTTFSLLSTNTRSAVWGGVGWARRQHFSLRARSAPAATMHDELMDELTGVWVGWEATFSSLSGKAQPLPDNVVPEEMQEWGQTPFGWEVLSNEGPGTGAQWARRVARVLPELGCAADNVAVEQASVEVDLQTAQVHHTPHGACSVWAVDTPAQAPSTVEEVRTVFIGPTDGRWPGAPDPPANEVQPTRKRVVVSFKLDTSNAELVGGVVVARMRRVSANAGDEGSCEAMAAVVRAVQGMTSEQATRGSARSLLLDAQTINRAIGERNFAECPCEVWGDTPPKVSTDGGSTVLRLKGGVKLVLDPTAGTVEVSAGMGDGQVAMSRRLGDGGVAASECGRSG